MTRDVVLTVRMSKDEYKLLSERADLTNLTISEYARRKMLGRVVVSDTNIAVLRELRSIAYILKKMYDVLKKMYDGSGDDNIASVLSDTKKILHMLSHILSNRDNDDSEKN